MDVMPIFEVIGSDDRVVFAFAKREVAERRAERSSMRVRPAEVAVGQRVKIRWHSWEKPGRAVRFEKAKIVVAFVPAVGKPAIERAFAVEDVAR